MRPLAAAALLSIVTFAGCGTTSETASPEPGTTATDSSTPEDTVSPSESTTETPAGSPIGAYNVLVDDVNGFFAAASSRAGEQPDAAPQDAEDLTELVGYEFTDGVRLIRYDVSTKAVCFTGPDNTYLTVSEPVEQIQRTLGTGGCDYEDGEVILEMRRTDDTSADTYVERVTKGAGIARQIPSLDGFDDVLNASVADDD